MFRRLSFYAIGQGLAYIIDIATFFLIVEVLHIGYPVAANVVSKIVSAVFAYFFHERFSFPGAKLRSQRQSALLFATVVVGNVFLTSTLLSVILSMAPVQPTVAKFIADVIGIGATYIAMRVLVFARAPGTR